MLGLRRLDYFRGNHSYWLIELQSPIIWPDGVSVKLMVIGWEFTYSIWLLVIVKVEVSAMGSSIRDL